MTEKMYCLNCDELVEVKETEEYDGLEYFCSRCGSDAVHETEKVAECDGCHETFLKDDLQDCKGLLDENYLSCSDCLAKALKEWRLISAAINESDRWKAMVNKALDGEIPFTA